MNTIVELIANQHLVEDIISNVVKDSNKECYKDLANDIYLELLEKPENILLCIYERNQIQYYLTRIVLNNVNSKTSRFYYKYCRWDLKKTDGEMPEVGEREKFDSEE